MNEQLKNVENGALVFLRYALVVMLILGELPNGPNPKPSAFSP